MNEVKNPKKPLVYYYAIVILVINYLSNAAKAASQVLKPSA